MVRVYWNPMAHTKMITDEKLERGSGFNGGYPDVGKMRVYPLRAAWATVATTSPSNEPQYQNPGTVNAGTRYKPLVYTLSFH